jgi:hypothetical protein
MSDEEVAAIDARASARVWRLWMSGEVASAARETLQEVRAGCGSLPPGLEAMMTLADEVLQVRMFTGGSEWCPGLTLTQGLKNLGLYYPKSRTIAIDLKRAVNNLVVHEMVGGNPLTDQEVILRIVRQMLPVLIHEVRHDYQHAWNFLRTRWFNEPLYLTHTRFWQEVDAEFFRELFKSTAGSDFFGFDPPIEQAFVDSKGDFMEFAESIGDLAVERWDYIYENPFKD